MERLFERRVFERINADFSGWYALKDEGGEIQGEFWGLDFSGSGVRVHSVKEITEDKVLEVSITSSTLSQPIQETARVAWQRKIEPGLWQAGLKFYQPRLMHFWPLVELKQHEIGQSGESAG